MRRLPALLSLLVLTTQLSAQTARHPTGAVASITADEVEHRIGIIADDSMLGRDTPSHGLEQTAQYVADEFQRFGLKPGGENGTWFQRYAITQRRFATDSSWITLKVRTTETRARFDASARLAQGTAPARPVTGSVILLAGDIPPDSAARLPIAGRLVLFVADYAKPISQNAIRALVTRHDGPAALLLLSTLDSAAFAARTMGDSRPRTVLDLGTPRPPIIQLQERAVAAVLTAAGVDVEQLRASSVPMLRELPGLTATLDLKDSVVSRETAPNTVGILEGSDPKLRHEYVVFSAHMDHIGITPGQADSINNGADDDGSGTVGVIELAQAFSKAHPRPKRSLIFLTVSGEEKGLWGSRYFSEHPAVPITDIVADINSDMIGRNWPDTIVAIGKEHSDLGTTLNRVNAAHPELGMTAIDDRWPDERFYFRSDHYNFARKGVPILFFFNGVHEDYHRVTDSPDKINSEKESRILRLIFYLGQEVANAPARPRWKPESYKEIVERE